MAFAITILSYVRNMSREINLKGWNNGESAAGFVAVLLGVSPLIIPIYLEDLEVTLQL